MLIREFAAEDRTGVRTMLRLHTTMPPEEIEQVMDQGQRLVALQDKALAGFATLCPRRPSAYTLGLLVDPAWRRQGIGSALWEKMRAIMPADARLVSCACPAESVAGQTFLRTRAFVPWFSVLLMHYSGPKFPDSTLTARPYNDDDCADWVRLINAGFLPLRQANDIIPNNVFPDNAASDPAVHQQLLHSGNDEDLLFYDDDHLIGLAELVGSEIDTATVADDQRRKGYGRRIIADCVNRILDRGTSPVSLHVVTWNIGARRLYESMGFRSVGQHDMLRLQLEQS